MSWTETELAELRRAYASGRARVSYDGKSVEYGSSADLLARIRIIEATIATAAGRPKPRRLRRLQQGITANWIDRAIGVVAPGAGLRRARQRQAMAILARAYEGAKLGRHCRLGRRGHRRQRRDCPGDRRLRDRSRDLVLLRRQGGRAFVSNMVGTGLRLGAGGVPGWPQADRLWSEFAASADADGSPTSPACRR